MIVCDLTHAYHGSSGGIRTYIDAKRRYTLEHTDHTHALVVPGEADRVTRGERTITIEVGAPLIPFSKPYRWFSRPARVRRALATVAPDVIELATAYMPAEWRPAFTYARSRGDASPLLVVMSHTDFADSYAEAYAAKAVGDTIGRGVGRLARRYSRAILERADLRTTPSPAQTEQLRRLGIEDAQTVLLGVDLKTFAPWHADPAVRSEHEIPPDAVFAIYVGRLDSEKRTDTLLEAARRADAARPTVVMLVGQGPHRDDLEQAQRQGAPIRILPYQSSKPALARLLATADLYLTAGPYETFGLSVVEAQASGLPVVGVEAGALVERVPPGVGRLVPVGDAAAMAEALLEVAAAPDALAQAARAHAEASFSWNAAFTRLYGLYDQALAAD